MKKAMLICLILGLVMTAGFASGAQEDLSATDEAVTLNYLVNCNPATEDLNTNVFYQEMAVKAGVNIIYECVYSDWDTKRTTRLASNDLPDAFAGWGAVKQTEIVNNEGLFEELSQYFDQYAPDIKAALASDPPYKKKVTDLNGNIYFLSNQQIFRPKTWTSYNLNRVWLDNVGMDVPETTDDLIEVLKAFRDRDANGNGDPDDEIPMLMYITAGEAWSVKSFMGAFDCATSINNLFALDNGKIEFQPITEEYRNFMRFVEVLGEESLIPKEAATMDWATFSARLGAEEPMVGLTTCWIHDPINIAYQADYITMPPLEGPEGHRYIAANPFLSAHEGTPSFVMSASNADPEKTMEFMNLFSIPEYAVQAHYGPVGISLSLENGLYTVNDPPEGMDWDTWTYKNAMHGTWAYYVPTSMENRFTAVPPAAAEKIRIDTINSPYIKENSIVFTPAFTPEQSENLAFLATDIEEYVKKMMVEWFVNGGVDEGWDDYLTELGKMGVDEYIAIWEAAYNR